MYNLPYGVCLTPNFDINLSFGCSKRFIFNNE